MSYDRREPERKPPTAEELRKRLARSVRKWRRARKLTIEQAAEAAGLGPRQWQKLEAGESNATLSTLARVAAALEVRVLDLLYQPSRPAPGRR